MAVSRRKKKAILRRYPSLSVKELASDLGLSEGQVKEVLQEEGLLSRRSFKIPALMAAAAVMILVLFYLVYGYLMRAGPGSLSMLQGKMNLLVVTVDTLRADRVGCYGFANARTPVMDGLASSGVRFERAYAHQPLTLPSHATVFTGTHPAWHGILDNGLFRLAGEALTLAEVLKEEGYRTGAVISAFVLHRQFGLDQGFELYDDRLSAGQAEREVGFEEMPASVAASRAVQWIDGNKEGKWFLWLHFFDPHADYLPPAEFMTEGMHPYDGEIAFVDHELGKVLRALEDNNLIENTLVVLTSDHGEALGEHGEPTHGKFLYESAMRVPLMVSLPGAVPGGRVVKKRVCLMDVMPSVLDMMGKDISPQVQGKSRLSLIYNEAADMYTAVLMETDAPWHQYGWSPSRAILQGAYKFIQAPKPELYNVEQDPGELTNLFDEDRGRAEAMERKLTAMRKSYAAGSIAAASSARMDEKTGRRLASLGYIFAGGKSGPRGKDLPDVKDMVDVIQWMKEASTLKSSGRVDEAIALLEKALQRSPDNRRALNRIGTWHAEKRDYTKAKAYFERLIKLDPDFIEAYLNLGQVLADTGGTERAMLMAEAALSRSPRSAKAYNLKGYALFMEKDFQAAVDNFKRAVRLYPAYDEAFANMGSAYYHLGDLEAAAKSYQSALRIAPDNAWYKKLLSELSKKTRGK